MPSTPRGQRTRQLIIERTAAVFDQLGFAGATLNQLVAATGLTRGAFYFHFDSKDALAEAIVQAQQERWLPVLDQLEAAEPDALRRLIRLTFSSGTLYQRDLVMRAGSRLMTERALIRRELWRSYPWWVDAIRRLLSEASAELPELSSLTTAHWPPPSAAPDGTSPGLTALAEHLVALWTGVQQLNTVGGGDDLAERLRLCWTVTLPWLCRDADRCSGLQSLVEELTQQMCDLRESQRDQDLAWSPQRAGALRTPLDGTSGTAELVG